ncbi:hypothetical protein N9W21_00020 [Shewanella sp.]|nr:hypothetical protein [Shewanella sp.]
MIKFLPIDIDEIALYKQATDSFMSSARNLMEDDVAEFVGFFNNFKLDELKTSLTKIQYTKNNTEQDLIYFDESTEFHFEVKLHIYALDEDNDKETLAGYILVLNSNMDVVDDFLV